MRHDRRGLTVLSLLIILIVVVLLIVILFRARSPVEETASLPEAPYPTAPEVEESAMLSSIIAPDSSVQVADSDTVAVRLTNSAEAPLVGITVRFEVTAGNGTVSPETVRTDSTGIAAAVWTYGAVAGPNSLRALADVPNSRVEPLLFTVEALEEDDR